MSYHGYIPLIKQHLNKLSHSPSVLEVGVERGVTTIPLITHMAQLSSVFTYVGVDVLVQEAVKLTIHYLDSPIPQHTHLLEKNSLEVLPLIADQQVTFDVILIDGDHNYHTVSQELQYIEKLLRPGGIVILDDYDGKWSERDLFYSERSSHKDVSITTKRVETEKHGVKPAVDDWLEKNPKWKKSKPIQGEPILLTL